MVRRVVVVVVDKRRMMTLFSRGGLIVARAWILLLVLLGLDSLRLKFLLGLALLMTFFLRNMLHSLHGDPRDNHHECCPTIRVKKDYVVSAVQRSTTLYDYKHEQVKSVSCLAVGHASLVLRRPGEMAGVPTRADKKTRLTVISHFLRLLSPHALNFLGSFPVRSEAQQKRY